MGRGINGVGGESGPAGLADLPLAVSMPFAFHKMLLRKGWTRSSCPAPLSHGPEKRESNLPTSQSSSRWKWSWQSEDFQLQAFCFPLSAGSLVFFTLYEQFSVSLCFGGFQRRGES